MDISTYEQELLSFLELHSPNAISSTDAKSDFRSWIEKYSRYILSSSDFVLLEKYPLLCPAVVSYLIDLSKIEEFDFRLILPLLNSVRIHPLLSTVVFRYFLQNEINFQNISNQSTIISILKIITCLISVERHCFGNLNFSSFFPLTYHKDSRIKWEAYKLFANLFQIDLEQIARLHFKDSFLLDSVDIDATPHTLKSINMCENHIKQLKHLTSTFSDWVDLQGILLPKATVGNYHYYPPNNLILVPTTKTTIQSIAFAIAQQAPILIRGEIGVGKTTLIKHIANLIGRSEDVITVQLSDQTDSKSLIGNYTSTEKPGQFVWKPGVLVHAMQAGKWLLLEDIDYAGKDVVSTLLPILENRVLPIPGMSESVTADLGFQIFATQRTNAKGQPMFSSEANLLEKYWSIVQVGCPDDNELALIIGEKYPNLSNTATKLVKIFLTITTESTESLYKRKLTLRDLMKWCKRIENFVDGLEAINLEGIFLEALDCFVVPFLSKNTQNSLAKQLADALGLNKPTLEYYLTNYKPRITFSSVNFCIGRALLPLRQTTIHIDVPIKTAKFAYTQQTSVLLERIAVCVQHGEPVLLVGETGTGKTSAVQHLATQTNNKLVVINMSRQSDTVDLLGGYKPVDLEYLMEPLKNTFLRYFEKTFSKSKNEVFMGHINATYQKKEWNTLTKMMEHVQIAARKKENLSDTSTKHWENFGRELKVARENVNEMRNAFAFRFVEGSLVRAIRNGWWVLLDEINLACPEVLECLNGILDQTTDSVHLTDIHNDVPIKKNEHFHIFACMNPALDVGKKRLPQGIENRFTEIFVHELTQKQDLTILINDYLQMASQSVEVVDSIVEFYLKVLRLASSQLVDGCGHKPHFSLRSLCRALRYSASNPCRNYLRSIYEGICLSFLTQLDQESYSTVEALACKIILNNSTATLKHKIPKPKDRLHYTDILGYWICRGNLECKMPEGYVITPAISKNLKDIARIVSARQYPILLQGPTSSGKTSLIQWLATTTGNRVYRINNHEHTDLQEYIGTYIPDRNGKLVFQEGLLPRAMRNGDWIILDELNLAPSDVLEALNRVLDDNRELFITETQTTIKAHPNFILFATQNPPGLYGGRKLLSRAFRNRFIELHFFEIPPNELIDILHQKCEIPKSYSKKMVNVMKELQLQRKLTGVFAGKQGYITLRDLFKWAERYRRTDVSQSKFYDWDQLLIEDGYLLLAGRLRHSEEIRTVVQVLEKHFKRNIDEDKLFNIAHPNTTNNIMEHSRSIMMCEIEGMQHIYATRSFRRLLIHVARALQFEESILLVGPTGSGKTSACQLISLLHQNKLQYINCHMHTETADFIGSLRPVRTREAIAEGRLFEWMDGPLVQAVRRGEYMLLDEISLADDAVLERLNSLLEPERTLVIAEKGGVEHCDSVEIRACEGFRLFGTMNPGGDFGKKELSPALRNRFTEIWCPETDTREDTISLLNHNLLQTLTPSDVSTRIVAFVEWFQSQPNSTNFPISKRDLLSWIEFINKCSIPSEDPWIPFIEGAHMVLIDGLGVGLSHALEGGGEMESCKLLHSLIPGELDYSPAQQGIQFINESDRIGINPFSIPKGRSMHHEDQTYSLATPTVGKNAYRILRALQLQKPILLEGIPGVGKSSIVMALAKYAGYELVRINLSEQTDINDLFGADLPCESGNAGEFVWRDGPLLRALKEGEWILLDELNLASQSVLEGLNSCFDHRQEIYITELDKTFKIRANSTRIFATQNPMRQGGGRKGLPKSFLNRFTKVFMQQLDASDLLLICNQTFGSIDEKILHLMVEFNQCMDACVNRDRTFGQMGSPFEFNLRDLFRWCQLMTCKSNGNLPWLNDPSYFLRLVYCDRMRNLSDKQQVVRMFQDVFRDYPDLIKTTRPSSFVYDIISTQNSIQIGQAVLARNTIEYAVGSTEELAILHYQLPFLESLMLCVANSWLPILVGGVGTGKSSVVRLLAELTGNNMKEFSVNSAMDSYELVGGFHQVGLSRKVKDCFGKFRSELLYLIKTLLSFNASNSTTMNHIQAMYSLTRYLSLHSQQLEENLIKSLNSIIKFTQDIATKSPAQFKQTFNTLIEPFITELKFIHSTLKTSENPKGCFAWIDSPLVESARKGYWLLIDNVNLCSASVLDRLNALLEPNGTIVLHEKGIVNGVCEEIKPHKNFRLFFCMDPKLGELSRAMRNRGVEICIPAVSEFQDFSCIKDIKYGLLGLKKNMREKQASCMLGIEYNVNEMETETFPEDNIQGNPWRSLRFMNISPILSNVLSESEILRSLIRDDNQLLLRDGLNLFISLSTPSDIHQRTQILDRYKNKSVFVISAQKSLQFIHTNNLHRSVTEKFGAIVSTQDLSFNPAYRESFCRVLRNQNMLIRVMNEVEKGNLRVKIFNVQLFSHNFLSNKRSLYYQSKLISENNKPLENMQFSCIKWLYPFVTNLLNSLLDEAFWDRHYHSNWDGIHQSFIWLQNFIAYLAETEPTIEVLIITWYLLKKNFIQYLTKKGIIWSELPDLNSLLNRMERELDTSLIESPLSDVYNSFSKQLPLNTTEAVNVAVRLFSLLEALEHISFVPCEIIRKISEVRATLYSFSLDLSNGSIDWNTVENTLTETEETIRIPLEANSFQNPLQSAKMLYFYQSILFICSKMSSYSLDSTILSQSFCQMFDYASQNDIEEINILALLHPSLQMEENNQNYNFVYLQLLITDTITSYSSLIEQPSNDELFIYLSNLAESLEGCSKPGGNPVGISLSDFQCKSQQLHDAINHFTYISFTQFVTKTSMFMTIFSLTLHEIIKSFNTIAPSIDLRNITVNPSLEELMEIAIATQDAISTHNTTEQVVKEKWQAIVANYEECLKHLQYWLETKDPKHQYNSTIYLGLTMVNLLAPYSPYDPIVISQKEVECLEKESENLLCDLSVHQLYYKMCFGITEVGLRIETPFPVEQLERRISNIQNEIGKLQKKLAIRPAHSQYPEIYTTCRKVTETICNSSQIVGILRKLENQQHKQKSRQIQILKTLTKSISGTISNLQKKYLSYPDVIGPFTFSLSILLHGLSNTIHMHQTSIQTPGYFILDKLIYFSNYDSEYPTNFDRISFFVESDIISKLPSRFREKFYRFVLTWIIELVVCNTTKNSKLELILYKVLDIYCREWNEFLEREKQKEIEKESLYKYKTVEHCIETSEELIEKDFSLKFPNYYENFQDISDTNLISDEKSISKPLGKEGGEHEDNVWSFNDETYTFLANTHLFFHSGNFLIPTNLFNRNSSKGSTDFITQRIHQQYTLAQSLSSHFNQSFGDAHSLKLSALHIAMGNFCIKTIEQQVTEVYDFYRDPNPSEIIQVGPVLNTFKSKINQLLEDWPEHSVLNRLILVADRILSFSITSPIMQVLTGLQILITKAQDWEAYAAKHVSIQAELSQISRLIIRFRKMELEGWPRVLEASHRKFEMKSSKYFLHIYQNLRKYFNLRSIDDGQELENISNLLKQFVEKSTLGDFEIKLRILESFKYAFKFPNSAFYTVSSLHLFYFQFLSDVKKKFDSQSQQLSKELKEFVSIAKWNDINYWRLKDSVEKSHRTIHKYVRKYELALSQPIDEILNVSTFNIQKFQEFTAPKWIFEMRENLVENLKARSPFDISSILLECEKNGIPLPTKTEKICTKFIKYCLQYADNETQYIHIQQLGKINSEIRESMNKLMSETKESLSPEDETGMKQQKFLCMKKQRQLSELFKFLKSLGFSNRFTSTGGKTLLDTLNFSSIPSLIPYIPCVKSVTDSMKKIDRLFFDNLKMIASLDLLLRMPHKQLTPYLVESLRAYTNDMVHSIVFHRQQTLYFSNYLTTINNNMITRHSHEDTTYGLKSSLPPPTQVYSYVRTFNSFLTSFLEQLNECSLLLSGITIDSKTYFPLDSSFLPKILSDQTVLITFQSVILSTIASVRDLFAGFQELRSREVFQWKDVHTLKSCYDSSGKVLDKLLSEITDKFANKINSSTEFGYFQGFFDLKTVIESNLQEIVIFESLVQNFAEHTQTDGAEKVLMTSDIFHTILTTLQNLTKNRKSSQEKIKESFDSGNTPELSENYLKNVLTKNEDLTLCNQEKIDNLITKTLTVLKSSLDEWFSSKGRSSTLLQSETTSFLQLQSLLEIYVTLSEHILLKQIEIQYSSNEMLQTILSIFNLLAAKGFCTPEAVIEEMAKEGETILQEFEGGGFGEGEGATNVSDQIENQEQIEDLRSEEPKNSNQENVTEEKGIEMSEDFDGEVGNKASEEGKKGESDGSEGEDDLDKRMGDVDDKEEQMDEKLWGESSEDEEDLKGDEEGGDKTKEERLVGKGESRKNRKKEENNQQNDDTGKEQDPDPMSEGLDDVDEQRKGELGENEETKEPEPLELPEDINLDGVEREDSIENPLESSDAESLDEMDTDLPEQEQDMDAAEDESNEDFNSKTMDNIESNSAKDENESNPDLEKDIPPPDTTDHAGDPQTATLSSKKFGTGTDGQMDEKVHDIDAHELSGKVSELNTSEGDGLVGNTCREENVSEKTLKSKLSRSSENRQLADESEKPQLKKQKVVNDEETLQNKKNLDKTNGPKSDLYKHKKPDSNPNDYDSTVLDSATNDQAKRQPPMGMLEQEDASLNSDDGSTNNPDAMRVELDRDAELHMDRKVTSDEKFTTQDIEDFVHENKELESIDETNSNRDLVSFYATNQEYFSTNSVIPQNELPIDLAEISELHITSEVQTLWGDTEREVSHLSRDLCEQLRLILQPQQASKLKGDYRTGKRLNMRKIIPYIASQYRNDKIWLRRTRPNKRQYQIMLAVDDSKSMANFNSKMIAFQTFALLGNALTWLDVGQLGVCKFGETTEVIMPLGTPFTQERAFQALQSLTMQQMKTKIAQMLQKVTPIMLRNRTHATSAFSDSINQLLIIISDGRGIFLEGRDIVERTVRQTMDSGIFVIFVILDSPTNRDSIVDIKVPIFRGTDTLPQFKSYLEIFPFPFYIVLRDIQTLPETVSNALRQWFEFVASSESQ